jgi:hypothetical protein
MTLDRSCVSLVLTVVLGSFAGLPAAEGHEAPFKTTFISASRNSHPDEMLSPQQQLFPSRYVAPKRDVSCSVRLVTLLGGKQEGVNLVVIDNGVMTITIVPTRGMTILSVQTGDVRLSWDSPVQEFVHPRFMSLQNRGGLGWLEGFNDWLCRCGLESTGAPGTDRLATSAGTEVTVDLPLHGRIANLPAQEVELSALPELPYRITLRGWVDEHMFNGPKLELYTELSTAPSSHEFQVHRRRDQSSQRRARVSDTLSHQRRPAPLRERSDATGAPCPGHGTR